MLWRCWLGGRKGIRPVKNWVVGRGKSGPALGGTEYRLMPSACRQIVRQPLWNLQFRYLGESCTNAKAKYSSSVVPPDPSVHFYHWWWGAGVVIFWSDVYICIWPSWCHCHSLSLAPIKIQIGLIFLVPAHLGSPGQRAVKRVCVWRHAELCNLSVLEHKLHSDSENWNITRTTWRRSRWQAGNVRTLASQFPHLYEF